MVVCAPYNDAPWSTAVRNVPPDRDPWVDPPERLHFTLGLGKSGEPSEEEAGICKLTFSACCLYEPKQEEQKSTQHRLCNIT